MLTMSGAVAVAGLFKQVSEPARLQILVALANAGPERNVIGIRGDLGGSVSQPSVSHHLALMRYGGLVEARRDGKHVFYHLTEKGRAVLAAAEVCVPAGAG